MLTAFPALIADETYFAELSAREFSRLDREGLAYLDYTGAALYAERQVRAHAEFLSQSVFGNPHSEHQYFRSMPHRTHIEAGLPAVPHA